MNMKKKIKHGKLNNRGYSSHLFITFIFILLSVFTFGSISKVWNSVTHDKTNFPLVGKHKTVSCSECHKKGILAGTPSECETCHLYKKNDDVHNFQLGVHCGECHTPTDWKIIKPGSWSHVIETGYPLEGQHRLSNCSQCHEDNIYSRVNSSCYNCHMDDYKRAKDPDHILVGYSTDCENCHNNTFDWGGASLDHDRFWRLRGPHFGHDCSVCHKNGYNITSDCINCHRDDYNRAKDPDHIKSGFSTDCSSCHLEGSFSWSQARFDHGFPIYSGKHQNILCSDCHQSTNYYEFACIDCHEHNKTDMDREHSGVGGYEYTSLNCYICHPDGN